MAGAAGPGAAWEAPARPMSGAPGLRRDPPAGRAGAGSCLSPVGSVGGPGSRGRSLFREGGSSLCA